MEFSFKKIFQSFQNHVLPFTYRQGGEVVITPHRDWLVLIAGGVFLGAIFVFVAVFLFIIVNEDETSSLISGERAPIRPIATEKLKSVIEMYQERERQFDALFNEAPSIADPSL